MTPEKLAKIDYGTVIDHIAAGKGPELIRILDLYDEPVSLIMNVESKKLGKKDILKIEGRHLDPDEVKEKIREVAPQATINLIENAEVVRKVRLAEL